MRKSEREWDIESERDRERESERDRWLGEGARGRRYMPTYRSYTHVSLSERNC